MFRLNKLILTSLTILMIATLTACSLGQSAAPTPTALDINAITTNVAATIQAQLTVSAPTVTLTVVITETSVETVTPTTGAAATNTQGTVSLEQTPVLTSTATPLLGGQTAIPSFTPVLAIGGGTPVVTGPVCKNAAFDGDITIPDGTEMGPWEKFEKVWGIKNTGTCTWDDGFFFAPTDGPPSMAKSQAYQGKHKFAATDRFIAPGETAYMSIDMYAPGDPGEYVAHWHMFDDNGQPFGQDVVVVIRVVKK